MMLGTTVLTMANVFLAPSAAADATDSLKAGVVAAHGSACGPLQTDPVVGQAAAAINGTTDKYLNHESRTVPETDALPLLHDLGSGASKAEILSSAAKDEGEAVEALLLQGYVKISDCSYTHFGANAMYNATKDLILMTVVLTA
jgi:hypothetical protein